MIPVAVGIDGDTDGEGSEATQIGEDLVSGHVGRAGVDDERASVSQDDADVLVERDVAADEDAVADLEPAGRAGRRRHVGQRSRSHA